MIKDTDAFFEVLLPKRKNNNVKSVTSILNPS